MFLFGKNDSVLMDGEPSNSVHQNLDCIARTAIRGSVQVKLGKLDEVSVLAVLPRRWSTPVNMNLIYVLPQLRLIKVT